MKRYSPLLFLANPLVEEFGGEWVKFSEANGLIKDLYDVLDRNSKKLIKQQARIKKLTEQNKEMLEVIKEANIKNKSIIEILSEILEGE